MSDEAPRVHVYRPACRYAVRVRCRGRRRWRVVMPGSKSKARAFGKLAEVMASGAYHRGEILLCADWLEPVPIASMRAES